MQAVFMKRLSKLLTVKSIVTIVATVVFAYQEIVGALSQEFLGIYTVIIAFYFGTQSAKQETV